MITEIENYVIYNATNAHYVHITELFNVFVILSQGDFKSQFILDY